MNKKYKYMSNVSNFAFGLLGRIQRDNMYTQNQNMKDDMEKLKINTITDPVQRQAAMDKFTKSKSGIGNAIKSRFDRFINTV